MEVSKAILLTFLCCIAGGRALAIIKSVQDYYWRDFNGLVPTDAIPGGNNENGEATYIGQFSVVAEYNADISNVHTLPAVITKGEEKAEAPYFGRAIYSNETSNVKVLCSNNLYKYKWFAKNAQYPPNCHFVVAGIEDNVPLYVGKSTKGRETVTGKLFAETTVHAPHLVAAHQGGETVFEKYDILTYCY